MIKWISAAWAQHRAWGWVATMDDRGVLHPSPRVAQRNASRRARRRNVARAELARRA